MSSFSQLEALIRDPLVKLSDLRAYLDAALHHDSIDDRKMLLEKLLVLMARLSENGTDRMKEISQTMQEFAIDLLYKDLPHPPSAFLSSNFPVAPPASTVTPNPKYASRSADGSGYSPFAPIMGMAGAPYARSVPGLSSVDPTSLPAPELVFDALLGRPKITKPDGKTEEKFTPHPGGVNALFFAIADLIIHSCFNTSPRDWTVNLASSYLDLSILYGSNEQELNTVRKRDGTGRLYEDVFGDKRLLFMPPASCALLVLLSRNHNYFAERILRINERGSFKAVESFKDDDKAKADQDNEIFARARLVNCGFFMHIILGDYVGAILGMVRDGYKWRLDPLMEFRRANHEHSPRGEGNVVSIEFNLLYRWHSTLSLEDTKWTTDIFKKVLGDKDPREVTTEEFHLAVRNAVKAPADPREWTFHGLKRDSRGKFDDSDLAKILQDSTKSRAAAYGAKGIPEAMRIIEILGIEQARSWGTCSLNEFRKFMGLKPYNSFEEWNSDPEVHGAAQQLYRNIDNLELHVGMQAEESKKPGPGAGLCPGYTISRAILADAVCLTRGDPYLTVNFTPFHFTTFGYNDCQYDHDDGTYGGGLLTKLLFRHLPRHYPPRSAYAHFPFFDPAYLRTLNLDEQSAVTTKIPISEYAWDYPRAIPVVAVGSWLGVSSVLDGTRDDFVNISSSKATKVFSAPYDWRLRAIIPDLGDKIPDTRAIRALLLKHKYRHAEWFARTAKALVASASVSTQSSPVRHLDVIRDVLNVLPIKFIANELAGLPEMEGLYTAFRDVCRYVYVNLEPEYDWHLREGSTKAFEQFRKVVKGHLDSMTSWLGVDETPLWTLDGGEDARSFLKELSVIGGGGEGKTAAVVALFVELVPNAVQFSQALAHVVNYALEKEVGEAVDIEKVLREDPLVWGTYRTALRDVTLPDSTKVKAGDNVWLGVADAGGVGDGDAWMGVGRHGLLNPELFGAIAPGVLKEILTLPGLKKEGEMRRFVEERNGSRLQQYVDVKGDVVPFPDSLRVRYGE